MAWVTPISFVTGSVLTAAQLNTYLINNVNFLYSPPCCLCGRTAPKAIAPNTLTAIDLDYEVYDPSNMHTGSSTQLFTTVAGKFLIVGTGNWQQNTIGWRTSYFYKTGNFTMVVTQTPIAGGDAINNLAYVDLCASTDYWELRTFHNSNITLTVSSSLSVNMIAG